MTLILITKKSSRLFVSVILRVLLQEIGDRKIEIRCQKSNLELEIESHLGKPILNDFLFTNNQCIYYESEDKVQKHVTTLGNIVAWTNQPSTNYANKCNTP